jgi:protein-disulfide isomerase
LVAAAGVLAAVAPLGVALGLAIGSAGCHDSNASGASASSSATAASAEVKDVNLPGIDTSAMTPRERHEFSGLVTSLVAPCPEVPVPVAQCVQESRPCGSCVRAAKWVAGAVRQGASDDAIQHAYKERFDPSTAKVLPLDDSPTRGPADAPVTIFEFADFECPHCAMAVPAIDAVLAAHPGKVRLVYKSYTLPFHVHGEPAARAAFAAGMQGKFWEMEHLLFERQQHLEDADLERYADILKLDIPKWKADIASASVNTRIDNDHKLGEDLKLKGTPTIYVNGRELDVENEESLEERVAGELGVPPAPPPSEGAIAPQPSAAASAAPPSSAAASSPAPSAKHP